MARLPRALRGDPGRIAPPPGWPSEPSEDRAPDWVAEGTPRPLRDALARAIGEEAVLSRAIDLVRYASDASPYRKIPRAVAQPRDVRDIVALMEVARARRAPLVFRAGGTSLNGQSQTDSILVDVRRHWQRVEVGDGGMTVSAQPGAVLGYVNRRLARHGRRLGPDPASTDVACVGGVVANNSGGMRCGVSADSYSTVRALKMVLASGAYIDTAAPGAEERFAAAEPELAAGLLGIREELRRDTRLVSRVRRKFAIKNTTGYRLCAFLDAQTPLEIFRRLLIGSEGTLAFMAEATFDTVGLGRHSILGLIAFESIDAACAAVGPLVGAGATATELMVAPTLIAAAWNMPGTPEAWKELPATAAALLVEFRDDEAGALADHERRALEILAGRETIAAPRFSSDHAEIEMLWRVREGMQGLLAAMRGPGVQLIIEDVCFPPDRLAEATRELQALLTQHGFLPGVAGHASAGNLHFLLTPNFGQPEDLERYDRFMHALAELVVDRYDGSLKAEHGTGLNMAPFVEREWGAKATAMMWRVKALADPDGILGPGILLNRDPQAHLTSLKGTPEIEPGATKCIECGFCEPVCPSRNVTTTPRQRIVIRREMARQPAGSPVQRVLTAQYEYDGIETCAADGMCRYACPVQIDTGAMIKDFRRQEHAPWAAGVARAAAQRADLVERLSRAALRVGAPVARRVRPALPPASAAGGRMPATAKEGAAAVYMPACINRIFGNPVGAPQEPSLPQALVTLSARGGAPLWIPDDLDGQCCGTPWSSKGYPGAHQVVGERITSALRRWSEDGRLPVVIDATSCTHGLLREVGPDGIEVLDVVSWVHDRLLPELRITRPLRRVAVHPNCSSVHLGVSGKLAAIAAALAEEVVVPAGTGCCGMAGDRGWIHPELPHSALHGIAEELGGCEAFLSSNRTCEAALQAETGRPYASFVFALEEASR